MSEVTRKSVKWISVLNDHSEWRSDQDLLRWFAQMLDKREVQLSEAALQRFCNSLCQMRRICYENHFAEELNLDWLEKEIAELRLSFDWPCKYPGLPLLRGKLDRDSSDEALLDSLRQALILQFSSDLAASLAAGTQVCVQRCEGLYRDANANKLSMVPEIEDHDELLWRQEIPVLVEKSLESITEIQRCADLFEASSRSKFCSDACRFSTFQIIKQLKEPNYLAEKQRRYRSKKN